MVLNPYGNAGPVGALVVLDLIKATPLWLDRSGLSQITPSWAGILATVTDMSDIGGDRRGCFLAMLVPCGAELGWGSRIWHAEVGGARGAGPGVPVAPSWSSHPTGLSWSGRKRGGLAFVLWA